MTFKTLSRLIALLALLTFSAARAEESTPAIQLGLSTSLWSTVLDERRPLQVHLPASYDKTRANYPVLYLLDGDRNFLHAVGALEFLAEGGRIPEAIVISIPNVDRGRDLTPCANGTDACGGADKFLRFLEQDLFPWVERTYRTERFRTLVGHSRGGQFAFYTLLNKPQLFNAYIAVSPALWINDAGIFKQAEAKLGKLPARRFLYCSDGNESVDITDNVKRMTKLLEQQSPKTLEWSCEHFDNDQHLTTLHKSIYNGMERIFSGLNVDRAVILSQGLAGVEAHYAKLEARYGYRLQPPKGMLEWMGYFLQQQGQPQDALKFFERNVELYPYEHSAYEALGGALQAVGRNEEAAAAFVKAYRRLNQW